MEKELFESVYQVAQAVRRSIARASRSQSTIDNKIIATARNAMEAGSRGYADFMRFLATLFITHNIKGYHSEVASENQNSGGKEEVKRVSKHVYEVLKALRGNPKLVNSVASTFATSLMVIDKKSKATAGSEGEDEDEYDEEEAESGDYTYGGETEEVAEVE